MKIIETSLHHSNALTKLISCIHYTFGINDAQQLHRIAELFEYKPLLKGEILLEKDKRCDSMFFILSGLVRVFVETKDKEVTQWIASKDYFLTDLSSFIFGTASRWKMQSLTDCAIYRIRKTDYERFKDIVPQWTEIERKFIVQCFTTIEDRVFSHLSMTAEERYNQFFEKNKELFNQVPLQYIASMLGMTPETFSRIRKKHLS